MGAAERPALLAQCTAMANEELLRLYAELLGDDDDKHYTSLPALALRDRAREGLVGEELIPLLVFCLVDAPNLSTFTHLAKALAAFGRQAEMASPYIVARLEDLHVTNDRRFWVLDSALWCLGYTGGEAARVYVEKLAAERASAGRPSKVSASKSVYLGELDDASRQSLFESTLGGVRALLALEDPGQWRDKRTEHEPKMGEKARGRMAPWMIR